jgi:competence protein ComEC
MAQEIDLILFLILIFLPQPVAQEQTETLIIWNVGQGAATTLVTDTSCLHIDMGGEFFPSALIVKCRTKKNVLFITHYDWDHINFIRRAQKSLPDICIAQKTADKLSRKKQFLLQPLPVCPSLPQEVVQITRAQFKKNNESNSYVIEKKILITGDAPQTQEREIVKNIANQKKEIQFLILGHHGSRTSTGRALLRELSHLHLAIASSRKKRYGHPHKEVMARLKEVTVPWISTEVYGHITIELEH